MRRNFRALIHAITFMLCIGSAYGEMQNVYVEKDMDDDQIIVITENGYNLVILWRPYVA